MIPLSLGFYCEQPQILLAGKKYIFGPQGSLLAQSLQLTRLPRLTSEDCAAPCWRHPGPFTPCSASVGGVGGGEGGAVPLLHWVPSRRRPSRNPQVPPTPSFGGADRPLPLPLSVPQFQGPTKSMKSPPHTHVLPLRYTQGWVPGVPS